MSARFFTFFTVFLFLPTIVMAQGYDGLMAPQADYKASNTQTQSTINDIYNRSLKEAQNARDYSDLYQVDTNDMVNYVKALQEKNARSGNPMTQKQLLKKAREDRAKKIAQQNLARHKQQAAAIQKAAQEKIEEERQKKLKLMNQQK